MRRFKDPRFILFDRESNFESTVTKSGGVVTAGHKKSSKKNQKLEKSAESALFKPKNRPLKWASAKIFLGFLIVGNLKNNPSTKFWKSR